MRAEISRYLRAKNTVVFQNISRNLRSAVVLTFPQIVDMCAVIPNDNWGRYIFIFIAVQYKDLFQQLVNSPLKFKLKILINAISSCVFMVDNPLSRSIPIIYGPWGITWNHNSLNIWAINLKRSCETTW